MERVLLAGCSLSASGARRDESLESLEGVGGAEDSVDVGVSWKGRRGSGRSKGGVFGIARLRIGIYYIDLSKHRYGFFHAVSKWIICFFQPGDRRDNCIGTLEEYSRDDNDIRGVSSV